MITLGLHDLPFLSAASIDLCAPGISGGGGDLFDCLDDGTYDPSTLTGTGLASLYAGDNAFAYPYGERYEDYTVGAYAGGAPGATADELGTIYVGDNPFGYPNGDLFEDYTVGTYAGGSPGVSATGLSTIYVGDGPTDWEKRVTVTNGGAQPSAGTVTAMETLRLGLVSAGLSSKFVSLCVFVPDSLIAACTPLILTSGNNLWTNNNFVIGDLTVDGLIGNASTKYLRTGVLGSSLSVSNVGLHVMMSDSASATGCYELGVYNGAAILFGFSRTAGSVTCFAWGGAAGDFVTGAVGATQSAFFSANRTASNALAIYWASQSQAFATLVSTSTAQVQGSTVGLELYALGLNNNGTMGFPSGHRLSAAAITNVGLTSGEAQTFYNLLAACRTSLGGGNP